MTVPPFPAAAKLHSKLDFSAGEPKPAAGPVPTAWPPELSCFSPGRAPASAPWGTAQSHAALLPCLPPGAVTKTSACPCINAHTNDAQWPQSAKHTNTFLPPEVCLQLLPVCISTCKNIAHKQNDQRHAKVTVGINARPIPTWPLELSCFSSGRTPASAPWGTAQSHAATLPRLSPTAVTKTSACPCINEHKNDTQ